MCIHTHTHMHARTHTYIYVVLVVQLCLTLCDPMHCSQPGFSVCGDSLGKNTGLGCHALLQGIFPIQGSNPGLPHCRQILYHLSHQGSPRFPGESEVAQSCPTLCDPWTIAHQAPPSMGLSRQERWSGLSCPPPGELPDPGKLPWRRHTSELQSHA